MSDELALRLDAFDRLDPGYVDNVRTGQENVNSSRIDGGRLNLRYAPSDQLDVELSGFLQNIHSHGVAQGDLTPGLQPLEGKYQYSAYFNPDPVTKFGLVNLTTTYGLDAGTITSATSYGHYRADQDHYDFTNAYGPVFGLLGETAANAALLANFVTTMNKLTQDLRFNSNRIGAWELLGGLFFTHEGVAYSPTVSGLNGVTGVLLLAPFDNFATVLTSSTYSEYAIYGDATFHFTNQWDATAGVRESHNAQNSNMGSSGLLTPPPASGEDLAHSSDSDTSYLFTLRWRPTDALSTYARAASAYRPGGPQFSPSPSVPNSFGPDTVWDYEVGAKGTWLDGRLSTDADVYYIKWRNIQLNALVNGLTITGNGGDAHSQGVEFQGQFKPVSSLLLGLSAAYNESRIDSVVADNKAGAVVGDPLPYTPRWSGALTGDYSFPVPHATGTLGATFRFQGAVPSSFSADAIDTEVTIPAYSVVDLRGRLDWPHYSVVLRVDNAADRYALSNIYYLRVFPGQAVPGQGVPIEPRTYRVSLETRF